MIGIKECVNWMVDNPGKNLIRKHEQEVLKVKYDRFEISEGTFSWCIMMEKHKGVSLTIFEKHEWQPEPQKVTWQEAIEAWADGKEVGIDYDNDYVIYRIHIFGDGSLDKDSIITFTPEAIKHGTWFIL